MLSVIKHKNQTFKLLFLFCVFNMLTTLYSTGLFNTRIANGVKMTPFDSLLVYIFSLACFQRKSSRDFSSFVGPYTVLEWGEFLSALKTIF